MSDKKPSLLWLWILLGVGGVFTVVCVACGGAVVVMIKSAQRTTATAEIDSSPEATNLKSIQIQRPNGPFVIRGDCTLTTFFNWDFTNAKETHYSIKLTQRTAPVTLKTIGDPVAEIHCYIQRDSDDGKKIFQLLSNGQTQRLTLECQSIWQSPEIAKLNRVVRWN